MKGFKRKLFVHVVEVKRTRKKTKSVKVNLAEKRRKCLSGV